MHIADQTPNDAGALQTLPVSASAWHVPAQFADVDLLHWQPACQLTGSDCRKVGGEARTDHLAQLQPVP